MTREEARVAGVEHRLDDTVTVLGRLKAEAPEVFERARVVGVWVWVEFEAKPAESVRDYLVSLGFHWNRKREAWQHCGGRPTVKSPGNPKWKYGVMPAEELLAGGVGNGLQGAHA